MAWSLSQRKPEIKMLVIITIITTNTGDWTSLGDLKMGILDSLTY